MTNTNTAGVSTKSNPANVTSERFKKMIFAAVFAALTYVVFTYLSIPVPTVGGKVTVHLGNAFAALGALLIGGFYGGLGGAIGLTIGDLLDPVYIVEAPATFIIKFLMGLLVGFVAHKLGHITAEKDPKKVFRWTAAAVLAGMIFNALADPSIRYVYKIFVLGKSAAEVTFAINFGVTVINSVVSTVLALAVYMALRTPLKKSGLFFIIK